MTAYVGRDGHKHDELGSYSRFKGSMGQAKLSPDGRYAVFDYPLDQLEVPSSWSRYVNAKGNFFHYPSAILYDMNTGAMTSLLQAPTGQAAFWSGDAAQPDYLWSSDSRNVVIVNTALPIDDNAPERMSTPYIVSYDLVTKHWTPIAPIFTREGTEEGSGAAGVRLIVSVERPAGGNTLIFHSILHSEVDWKAPKDTYLKLSGGEWRLASPPPGKKESVSASAGLIVTARQDMNTPPVVVAELGSRRLTLTQPDPALKGIWRATVRPFSWNEGGRTYTAGLLLPRNADPARKIPLIIQYYKYQPKLFRPDGPFWASYAAQSFAAQGFAVLQLEILNYERPEISATPIEGAAVVKHLDSVIDALTERANIDQRRVGVIGFSRSAYHVLYAITHPGRHCLAAAIANDGWLGSFQSYLAAGAVDPDDTPQYEKQFGGPYWSKREQWNRLTTDMNVDKVRTPVMVTVNGDIDDYLSTPLLGAFRINKKPVEWFNLSNAGHQPQLPKERLFLMAQGVQWMSFWLQGREVPLEGSIDRFEYWRELRQSWQKDPQSCKMGD